MSEKKQLNVEELEKVSGGSNDTYTSYFKIYFINASGKEDHSAIEVSYTGIRTDSMDEADCRNWCEINGYTFIKYEPITESEYQIVATTK